MLNECTSSFSWVPLFHEWTSHTSQDCSTNSSELTVEPCLICHMHCEKHFYLHHFVSFRCGRAQGGSACGEQALLDKIAHVDGVGSISVSYQPKPEIGRKGESIFLPLMHARAFQSRWVDKQIRGKSRIKMFNTWLEVRYTSVADKSAKLTSPSVTSIVNGMQIK